MPRFSDDADRACSLLKEGHIIALPTDTVYGLAALPFNDKGLARLYELKGRPYEKPFPLLIDDVTNLDKYALAPERARGLAHRFWPGPLTLLLKARADTGLPDHIVWQGKIGLRCPAHAFALEIIKKAGGALAVTSANKSRGSPALTAQAVADIFGGDTELALILENPTTPEQNRQASSTASTIIDLTDGLKIIRAGRIDPATVLSAISSQS